MNNLFQNIETITFSKSANQFLYFLSHAPIFKRFFHADLVGEYEAKSGISLALRSIGYLYAFLRKVFYLSLIVSFMELMEDRATFGHIFFFFTIAGACMKRIFNFSEEKHYLFLRLYRMPAMRYVKYTLHHYLFFEALYFGIALLFVSKFTSIPYWHMLIYLAMYLSLHLIGEAIYFFFIMRNDCKITNENRILFTTFGLGLFFFLCAMQVFFTKLYIGEMGMLIIGMIVCLLGIYAYDYLLHKPNYHRIFKYNLSLDAIAEANTFAGGGTYAFISLMEMQENLDDSAIQGDKKGYEYIHAAFQNRYRKSLYRGQIWYMLIEIVIGLALLIIPFFFPDFDRSTIAEFTTKGLAAVLYLIYLFSSSCKKYSLSCFLQMDRYLVNYHFFRRSKDIAKNFRLRLKDSFFIILRPTLILIVILVTLYLVHSPSGSIHLASILVQILFPLSLAIFYSVYALSAYYLFQPFSQEGMIVNKGFAITDYLVYLVSYLSFISRIEFDIRVVAICIPILALISLALYYSVLKFAPKRFRVR